MKNYLKVLTACIFCTLLFGACNNASSADSNFIAKNESLIKEVVDSYLTEINSGAFAAQLYNSKLSPDLAIKGISFAQPQAQTLMNESMAHMTFKIYGVKSATKSFGDLFDKRIKANCLVEVSVVDIENSLKKINSPFIGYPDIIKWLPQSDKTSITKKNILLTLAYSDENMQWEITNNSQLMNLIMDPYKNMTLENPAGRPDTVVDEFIQSVLIMDTEKILELSGANLEENDLARGLGEIDLEEMKRVLPYAQIEVITDSNLLPENAIYYWPDIATIPLRVSFPDIRGALRDLGHIASTDEIVELLEKNQDSKRIFFDEQNLHLQMNSQENIWHTIDEFDSTSKDYGIPNVVFKFIVKNVHAAVYNYPYLPDPLKTADQ